MSKTSRIAAWLRKPSFIIWVICMLLLLVTMFFTHRLRAYNSDDVFWQNILLSWHPFNGDQVALGNSVNYLSKVPFFALVNHFIEPSRRTLLFESAVFAVGGFSAFYVSTLYFLKKAKLQLSYTNLLPLVWLASFGYTFSQLFLNPDWRGFEVGLSFLVFALVAMLYYGDVKVESLLSKLTLGLITIVAGVFIYSDPYYLYFTVGPILLISPVLLRLKMASRRQVLIVYVCTFASLLIAKLTSILAVKSGLKLMISVPMEFVSFDKLPQNVMDAFHSLLMIFGADFFGKAVASLLAIAALVNFMLLGWIAIHLYRDYHQPKFKNPAVMWRLFFGTIGIFSFLVYTLSTLASVLAYRYLFMMVFCLVLFMVLTIGAIKQTKLPIIIGLLLAVILNLTLTIKGNEGFLQAGSLGNKANTINYQIIDTLRDRGLTKGYVNYWQGGINTYLSKGQIDFLPVSCPGGVTVPFHWLIDTSRFNTPADKSFYIIDEDFRDVDSCTVEQINAQFGPASKTIYITNKTILIYDYDLQPKPQN